MISILLFMLCLSIETFSPAFTDSIKYQKVLFEQSLIMIKIAPQGLSMCQEKKFTVKLLHYDCFI